MAISPWGTASSDGAASLYAPFHPACMRACTTYAAAFWHDPAAAAAGKPFPSDENGPFYERDFIAFAFLCSFELARRFRRRRLYYFRPLFTWTRALFCDPASFWVSTRKKVRLRFLNGDLVCGWDTLHPFRNGTYAVNGTTQDFIERKRRISPTLSSIGFFVTMISGCYHFSPPRCRHIVRRDAGMQATVSPLFNSSSPLRESNFRSCTSTRPRQRRPS